MSESPVFGEAIVHRFVDNLSNALFAHGDFTLLIDAYLAHTRRWSEAPEPLVATMMSQGLAGGALHLSCRPRDETVGWTISIQQPAINLFLTGDSGDNAITGRGFTKGVQEAESNRLFVQSTRPQSAVRQTMLEVEGLDVLSIFEQYHERSEQFPARFFDYDNGQYAMVLGLPGIDREWLLGLDRESTLDHIDKNARLLDRRTFEFRCGCRPERMHEVLRSVYAHDAHGLFLQDESVEVECPRCGHRWDVTREEFEAGLE